MKPYTLPLCTSFRNDYLKNKLLRGSLDIRCRNDFVKLAEAAGERINTLQMFFFNEHITDKDIREISAKVSKIGQLESVIADFGK